MSHGIDVEALADADPEEIRAFVDALSARDRTFLHPGLDQPGGMEDWISSPGAQDQRFIATADGSLVGCLAVLPGHDWRSHVAELRIVIHPAHRRQGVATQLARHAVITAVKSGIDKLFVNVMADESGTTAMFTSLGFEAEGLLRNHVRGTDGEVHDLLLLSHFVDEMVESMSAAGIGSVLDE